MSGARTRLCRNLQRTLPGIEVRRVSLPMCPAMALWLIDPGFPRGQLPPEVASAVLERPAYWAFCWASGQALASHLLARPERVAGKTVLDLGSGSGVVAIAAALAGAARVIACDIDADARDAVRANAELNGVEIELLASIEALHTAIDVVLVADLFYDLANHGLAARLPGLAGEVLIADSRLKDLPPGGYRQVAEINADTLPDLDESPEFRRVRIFEPAPR